jgi:hypothetical protein
VQSVLGIFDSRAVAEQAVQGLLATPIAQRSIIFLSGEAGKAQVENLTTTDTERNGMREVVGGVVGGAVGTGVGLALGSAIAGLLVPGVAPSSPSAWELPQCLDSMAPLPERLLGKLLKRPRTLASRRMTR